MLSPRPTARQSRPSPQTAFAVIALALTAAPALAQPTITSFTIDCGGQVTTGGTLRLTSSIGQPDAAGPLTNGLVRLRGGFLHVATAPAPPCPADFNADGDLNPDDLADYIGAYFAQPPGAGSDFNSDGETNPDDLADYIGAFFGGC